MTGPPVDRLREPVRLALVTPYFGFFEDRFPSGFRAEQGRHAASHADLLRSRGFHVTESGLVDSQESAAVARRRLVEARPDVIVIAATMASPPEHVLAALPDGRIPIIIWDERRVTHFADTMDEVEATRTSNLLGSVMVGGALARLDRAFVVATASSADPTALLRAIRGAAAAAGMAQARLGVLGGPMSGYGHVSVGGDDAERLGIAIVPIGVEALAGATLEASTNVPNQLDPLAYQVSPDARPLLPRSLRLAAALTRLCRERSLDGLAMNCHSADLRWGELHGVVGCLGATMLASAGVSVSCTGDSATGLALLLATRLAGHAQYGEGYAVESATGELLISSCGLGHPALADGAPMEVVANALYPGSAGLGCGVRFPFAEGPATIIAFAPGSGARAPTFVYATGRLTGRTFSALNGPSGTFAFDGSDSQATRAWISTGPAHHVALARGNLDVELQAAAAFLGVGVVRAG